MAPIYSYIVTDIVTGAVREEIPFSTMQFTIGLNVAGGFVATGPLYTSENANSGFNKMSASVVEPGRTELWVLRNKVVLYGGIIWGVQANIDTREISVHGKDHLSYLERRVLDKTHKFSGVDQFTIIKTLVDYMSSATSGDIGLTVGSATSGINRTRTFYNTEYRRYADILREFAEVDNGFDYTIEFGGGIQTGFTKNLKLENRRGRSTDIAFEVGKNIELLEYSDDAWPMANRVTAVGAGEGSEQISSVAADASSLNLFPLLEEQVAFKAMQDRSFIVAKAKDELKRRNDPIQTVVANIVSIDPDAKLGSFIVGDDLTVSVKQGYVNLQSKRMRVMSYDVKIDENGKESMKVRLTQLESTV